MSFTATEIATPSSRTAAAGGPSPSPTVKAPAHPERVCWGCDRHCRADDLFCGEDKARAAHPSEFFGEDWHAGTASRSG